MTSIIRGNDNFDSATVPAAIQGARAWVNWNGEGTVAIRASHNVSSITDNGTGQYTINFSPALNNANYAVGCGGGDSSDTGVFDMNIARSNATPTAPTTTQCGVSTTTPGGVTDFEFIMAIVFST